MNDPRHNLEAQLCDRSGEALPGIFNPPGLAALAYRIGRHPDFLRRMLAGLPLETLPDGRHAGDRPLAGLSTRELDDPAIALLDTWATAADILTFYQERIANESYLRTAVERRSLLELARLVGQELSPGVSASAFLAFEAEDAPGSPEAVAIPRGTRVQSIPDQRGLPQTFETAVELVARSAFNALRPRLGRPLELRGASTLYLGGTATRLTAGDTLLLVIEKPGGGGLLETRPAVITEVEADAGRDLTRVRLESPIDWQSPDLAALPAPLLFAAARVFALRQRTPFFGHNAPRYGSLPRQGVVKNDPYGEDDPAADWDAGRTIWTDSRGELHAGGGTLEPAVLLERKIPEIVAGSWVVFTGLPLPPLGPAGGAATAAGPASAVYRVRGIAEATVADYAFSGEVTGLALALPDGEPLPPLELANGRVDSAEGRVEVIDFDVRRTTALVVSEELALAEEPIFEPFPSAGIDSGRGVFTLASPITGLAAAGLGAGRLLALSGERAGGRAGARETRILVLQGLDHESLPGATRLLFETGLEDGLFVRDTLAVNANVVLATHGETVAEVLGSGDGELADQSFELRSLPLAFLSAPLPGGAQSTLEVRVDGVLWREVATLYGQPGDAQVYTLRIEDDGRTRVTFGDGRSGARLPSGAENVIGSYRRGTGLDGNVAADSLQLLQTRPLGIRQVSNPLPAAGGAPRDEVAEARRGAPVRVRTRGRIVSLADFDDFARTFAGISKVRCQQLAGIHLTVAGVGGAPVAPGSALYGNLFRAIEAARLPGPPLKLESYEPLPVAIEAQVVVDPRFRAEQVLAAVEAALAAAFAFDRRELAEPLYAARVIPVMQAIPGVVAVSLDRFYVAGSPPGFSSFLQARAARLEGGRARPAQLLLVLPGAIALKVRTP